MSSTLNYAQHLLSLGQRYFQLGRIEDAFSVLTRLTSIRDLPESISEEAHVCLGEIEIRRKNFKNARRHLQIALNLQPDHARAHYLMGLAIRSRKDNRQEKASEHFERSLELEPKQLDCLARAGLLLVRRGHTEKGLEKLRSAWEQSENDPQYLSHYTRGLRLAGRLDEARKELRLALFANRSDRRFLKLWNDFRFYEARRASRKTLAKRNAPEPVILRFEQASVKESVECYEDEATLRIDGATAYGAPHRSMHSSDQPHVQ